MRKYFHFHISFDCSINGYIPFNKMKKGVLFCSEILRVKPCWLALLPGEWQKYHVFDAFATHAGCIHNITRADCWTQNGSVNRCVFMIYKQMSVFNKWDEKLSEKTSGGTFTIPFLSISPVTLFGFGSPLSPANHTCCIRVTQHSNQNSQHILKNIQKNKLNKKQTKNNQTMMLF